MGYSREEISLFLYYKELEGADRGISASGLAEENAGRNSDIIDFKRDCIMPSGSSDCQKWLPGLGFYQTISIILPNVIHSCKKKNL